MQGEVFFAEAPGGGVSILKGDALQNPRWISYSSHIYRKQPRARDKPLFYRFERTIEVNRCAHFLSDKNGRCKNEAVEGAKFCHQHAGETAAN